MVLRNPRLWRNQRNTPEGLKLDPHLKWGLLIRASEDVEME